MHLLILDDNAEIHGFLTTLAKGLGWTVDSALNAPEFQAQIAAREPDAILLDLHLGATDGIAQLRHLQNRYSGPIILMSGFDDRVLRAAEQMGSALGLSIAGGLRKPMRAAEVRNILKKIENDRAPITATDIESGLGNGEIWIAMQPVIDARTSAVHHLEALLRWTHPSRGNIPPALFIPIAERAPPCIAALTDWVIGAAIEAHRGLLEDGYEVPIAINVSRSNLDDLAFPDKVTDRLDAAGVPPSALMLEITESVASADSTAILDILVRLRLKGIDLAIDDFGTGYSSLTALHRLPFSELKIDRSFVLDLCQSRESLAIVRSVIDLARTLGLRSVAEGVETQETAELLRDLGVDCLQGYLFTRPLSREPLRAWLRQWAQAHPGAVAGLHAAVPKTRPADA